MSEKIAQVSAMSVIRGSFVLCRGQTGSILLSVLRVREVSVFGGFFVQRLPDIVRDLRKCPFYRKCPPLGGVR